MTFIFFGFGLLFYVLLLFFNVVLMWKIVVASFYIYIDRCASSQSN